MAIPSRDLSIILNKQLPNAKIFLSDVSCAIPNRNWLWGDFYKMFRKNLEANNLYKWRTYHDCDNKAVKFWQFASDCHAMTMMLREKQGLQIYEGIAVGVIFFNSETLGGGHAINFALTNKGLEFIEPQDGRFIQLSKEERESSWFAVF